MERRERMRRERRESGEKGEGERGGGRGEGKWRRGKWREEMGRKEGDERGVMSGPIMKCDRCQLGLAHPSHNVSHLYFPSIL